MKDSSPEHRRKYTVKRQGHPVCTLHVRHSPCPYCSWGMQVIHKAMFQGCEYSCPNIGIVVSGFSWHKTRFPRGSWNWDMATHSFWFHWDRGDIFVDLNNPCRLYTHLTFHQRRYNRFADWMDFLHNSVGKCRLVCGSPLYKEHSDHTGFENIHRHTFVVRMPQWNRCLEKYSRLDFFTIIIIIC